MALYSTYSGIPLISDALISESIKKCDSKCFTYVSLHVKACIETIRETNNVSDPLCLAEHVVSHEIELYPKIEGW